MSQLIIQVFSPDGFCIYRDKTYTSNEEAKLHFTKWAKRFENQGYHSSNKGRIPLDQLEKSCTFKEFDKEKCTGIELAYFSNGYLILRDYLGKRAGELSFHFLMFFSLTT